MPCCYVPSFCPGLECRLPTVLYSSLLHILHIQTALFKLAKENSPSFVRIIGQNLRVSVALFNISILFASVSGGIALQLLGFADLACCILTVLAANWQNRNYWTDHAQSFLSIGLANRRGWVMFLLGSMNWEAVISGCLVTL